MLRSGLAAISVPPPGLPALEARLLDDPADPGIAALPLEALGLDSLARMEFCIQLELDHGVPLTPDRLAAMADLGELLAFIAAARPADAAP